MCPEFLREGSGVADFFNPPFVVLGTADQRVSDLLTEMFSFLEPRDQAGRRPQRRGTEVRLQRLPRDEGRPSPTRWRASSGCSGSTPERS